MNIHEYQSKEILRKYGVPVPNGKPAFTVEEAVNVAKELNSPVTVVKAQIHAGGRGKAGGVKLAKNLDEVKTYATELLGKILVTHQTGADGKKVNRLLIEEGSNIKKEYYLSFVIDRTTARVVMMGSEEGGVEIEKVAAETPEKIFREYIDPAVGLMPFQASKIAYKMNFPPAAIRKATAFILKLYSIFIGEDCSQVEINPLVVTAEDDVIALDAKLNFDDSALFRHPDIEALRDETEEDILKHYGGNPANFLDVGGDSTPEKIATAFKIMLDGGQAKGIFVNIFGGINRCDAIAAGIVEAAKIISEDGKSLPVPVVVRLEGTNVEIGRQILKDSPIKNVIMAPTMEDGAKEVVRLVNEA